MEQNEVKPKRKRGASKSEVLVPAQLFVTRQYKRGSDQGEPLTKEETIEVHRFETEPARVSVEVGLTLNLGNYESAKLSVAVSVPCYKEEMDDAFVCARNWVTDRLTNERDLIRGKKDTDII